MPRATRTAFPEPPAALAKAYERRVMAAFRAAGLHQVGFVLGYDGLKPVLRTCGFRHCRDNINAGLRAAAYRPRRGGYRGGPYIFSVPRILAFLCGRALAVAVTRPTGREPYGVNPFEALLPAEPHPNERSFATFSGSEPPRPAEARGPLRAPRGAADAERRAVARAVRRWTRP